MAEVRTIPDPHDDLAPSAPVSAAAGLTLKAALILGFGITLGTWLVAWYGMTQRTADVEAHTAEITARYVAAQEALSEVRAQVLVGTVVVRDALLDETRATPEATYRELLEDAFAKVDASLREYVPFLNTPRERAAISALRAEMDALRAALRDVLRSRRWPRDATQRRQEVIRISEQVQTINRQAFIQQEADIRNLNRAAQEQAWRRIGVAVAASLLIGVLATLYATRLEARLRSQRMRDLRITADLHSLSARLATAQEDERRLIARELHDEVGQALTAINVELSIAHRTSGVPPAALERLNEARRMAEGTVETIRNLSQLLHPPLLDDLGLAAALKHQLDTFSRRHDIRADLVHESGDRRLAPELEVALYRIVQEALTNVAKHARATSCRVTVRDTASSVQVTIEDDGSGFDARERDVERLTHSQGVGLIGMRERAQQLGGTFEVDSAPGRGTRIIVEMPARPAGALEVQNVDSRHEVGIHGKPAHFSR
jgi:signal transduction histidine kinase